MGGGGKGMLTINDGILVADKRTGLLRSQRGVGDYLLRGSGAGEAAELGGGGESTGRPPQQLGGHHPEAEACRAAGVERM